VEVILSHDEELERLARECDRVMRLSLFGTESRASSEGSDDATEDVSLAVPVTASATEGASGATGGAKDATVAEADAEAATSSVAKAPEGATTREVSNAACTTFGISVILNNKP
jgi:hypothetical protein